MMKEIDGWYKRFQVPVKQLSKIEEKLFQFNIHDLSLFPDTEGLAGFVKQKLRLQFQWKLCDSAAAPAGSASTRPTFTEITPS
jgi:hypothetical protein